jgi:hypothetical protein
MIARHLLIMGASRSIRDPSGKTPADLARENYDFEIAALLEGHKRLLQRADGVQ